MMMLFSITGEHRSQKMPPPLAGQDPPAEFRLILLFRIVGEE